MKKILAKEAQTLANFLSNFEKVTIQVKTTVAYFWATVVKIGLLLIPSSGHTDWLVGEVGHKDSTRADTHGRSRKGK